MKEQRAFFPTSFPEGVYLVALHTHVCVCAYVRGIKGEHCFGLRSCRGCGDHVPGMWAHGRQFFRGEQNTSCNVS